MIRLSEQRRTAPSWVRALDGRVKIALLVAYSVCLFFIDGLTGLAVAAVLLSAAGAVGRLALGPVLRAAAPAYVIAAFLLLYNGASLGWTSALVVTGRILLLVYASVVLVSLSTATELTAALQRLLAPLGRVGLPVRDATTALSIALRFMPVTAEELAAVRRAQAARGATFDSGGLVGRLRAYGGLMVPLFVGLFRRADRLACAMDARCFGAAKTPTHLDEPRFGAADAVALAVGVGLCALLPFIP
ncbi:energy-coupling factor transporter transmembrane component T family protein [Adlercreutzia mucosicola]|uniref:energy-coupling factor transporter transmembrane component T family protein n=1 Tax=Adlercreutzia mucosicola TaxID=580026 RepID=UPI0009FE8966|nr:energy-coupling factor transporter transmembrane component T [Adlercreutzia mucosicola]MCR2034953.1 energy-coupling factor transporter transmembrane protein EcfT [Adlercreutzia mucosicola]